MKYLDYMAAKVLYQLKDLFFVREVGQNQELERNGEHRVLLATVLCRYMLSCIFAHFS